MATTTPSPRMAQIGTSSLGWICAIELDQKKALSLPSAHVRRDVVCTVAIVTIRPLARRIAKNAVAAAREPDARCQSSKIGSLS